MKIRLLVASAALALAAGSASASTMTASQHDMLRNQVLQASEAGGQVTPTKDTDQWKIGATVPESYESAPVRNIDGMEGYSYLNDGRNIFVLDTHRKVVETMKVPASGAGGQTTLNANGQPESAPVKQ